MANVTLVLQRNEVTEKNATWLSDGIKICFLLERTADQIVMTLLEEPYPESYDGWLEDRKVYFASNPTHKDEVIPKIDVSVGDTSQLIVIEIAKLLKEKGLSPED